MTISGVDGGRLVLDTSAYSQMRRGHAAVLDAVAAATVVLLPTVVLGELEGGFALGARREENRRELAEFLDEPFVDVMPLTAAVAHRYGSLYARLRRAGTPIPTNDLWIAAATFESGGELLTFDHHFRQVESLACRLLR